MVDWKTSEKMRKLGREYREDWSSVDGRTLRDEFDELAHEFEKEAEEEMSRLEERVKVLEETKRGLEKLFDKDSYIEDEDSVLVGPDCYIIFGDDYRKAVSRIRLREPEECPKDKCDGDHILMDIPGKPICYEYYKCYFYEEPKEIMDELCSIMDKMDDHIPCPECKGIIHSITPCLNCNGARFIPISKESEEGKGTRYPPPKKRPSFFEPEDPKEPYNKEKEKGYLRSPNGWIRCPTCNQIAPPDWSDSSDDGPKEPEHKDEQVCEHPECKLSPCYEYSRTILTMCPKRLYKDQRFKFTKLFEEDPKEPEDGGEILGHDFLLYPKGNSGIKSRGPLKKDPKESYKVLFKEKVMAEKVRRNMILDEIDKEEGGE